MPDDRVFVAMLAIWAVLLALATYILLGWTGTGVILGIGGLGGALTIIAEGRETPQRNRFVLSFV